ncbi:MAG: family 20 glycosylhydrolase [Candidatus Marinimicrobia bacterium]|nr:family 20 glycosylhydrolase [Candidatus Neomarinimicrobiota bacterium]
MTLPTAGIRRNRGCTGAVIRIPVPPGEFTPFDIARCAEETLYGNPVDPDMFSNKVFLTEKGKGNIRGLSGTLWGENLRSWERVEYMAFPKVLGLAERAWSAQPEWARTAERDERMKKREKAWNVFVNKVGQDETAPPGPRCGDYGTAFLCRERWSRTEC